VVAEAAGAVARPRYPPSPAGSGVATATPHDGAHGPPPSSSDPRANRRLPDPSEFRYLREEPRGTSGRGRLLAAVAAVVVLAGVLIAVLASGSSGSSHSSASTGTHSASARHAPGASHGGASTAASGPAQLHVVVLNSTEINGLAHRLAATLQEHGYTSAQAQSAHPSGSYTASVVEYAPGYTAEAEAVARALGIEASGVRPMESTTQSLTPGASVVVVAAGSEAAGGSTG